jgi:hypothetical protein
MMDMNKIFGSGIMLAALTATFAVFAQDATDDELLPAVDTSAEVADTAPAEQDDVVDERAEDVTRSETGNQVMDSMELGRTEITGNQELPKVLVIVPWQKSDPSDLMGRPVNTLLDDVLAPLDREEFVREVNYFGDLNETEE